MIIKPAEDKARDIAELNALLSLPGLNASTKKQIDQEIKNIQSGLKGEEETAYQMAVHYAESKNWMVIHDLRLEHNGMVAQIDHLMLNRFMEIYVCESKRFSEGVSINEHGEFATFYQGKARGIPSPIEQNNRHIILLNKLFNSGRIELPTRLGFDMAPRLISLILVANSARISRPKNAGKIAGLDRIIKNEQLKKKIEKDFDNEGLFSTISSVSKVISSETLQNFAESLAALHQPIEINWKARFGITDNISEPLIAPATVATEPKEEPTDTLHSNTAEAETKATEAPIEDEVKTESMATSEEAADSKASQPKRLFCAACQKSVTPTVARFCWNNKAKFQGKVYCFHCQKKI